MTDREKKITVSERTIIDKIMSGIRQNGWKVHNGLGTGVYNPDATLKSMAKPLVDYLRKKGIDVR